MEFQLQRQLGYASGNFGKSLMWTSLDYLQLFYLTEVAGIPVGWAGAIILLSLLWDGAINPFIGYWIDRRASAGLDYRPFLRWAPVASGIGFVALFWLPSEQAATNAAYLLVAMLGFRTAYALLDVPHNALLAHMPVTSAMRMRLAGMRFFFSSLGGLIVATLVAPQFVKTDPASVGGSLLMMAAIAAVLLCLTIWLSLGPSRLAMAERGLGHEAINPAKFLKAILRNKTAVLYLALAAIFAATTPLFAKILPYLLQYVRREPDLLPILLASLTIGQLIAMPIWTCLLVRVKSLAIGLITLVGLASTFVLTFWLKQSPLAIIVLATWLLGFFLGGAIQIIWGLAGDVADRIAEEARIRVDGGLLAFLTLVQKAAIGLGAVVAGFALEASSFKTGAMQGLPALRIIEVLSLFVPAGGAIAAAILFWRLSRALNQK
ncbi:MFS transporter [Novosphingobium flavum]|uniref:MFS transporter n=1 Tax=Novosphingobium aerophilum TaxID=2839843 RepID=UPI0016398FAD|nr:MFS transporter [Novosphingobium aerophilum]MBC2663502.1 MFS transporter [Novosphingobium aerophilum]